MDPTQALIDLLDAIEHQDREDAVIAAKALAGWLERGGFLPDPPDAGGYR